MIERRTSEARPLFWIIAAIALAIGLGGLLVWGYLAGRGEATAEAQRERPIKAAARVSRNSAGLPVITLGAELQKQADIQTALPRAAPYQQQVQAYGSVLDLQPFTDLCNTIASAKAQLAIVQAKLAASRAAFDRAQALYKNGQNFSAAQLQAAEAAYQSDSASVDAAQVQTRNAAASAVQAWGSVLGRSLTGGTALAQALIEHEKVLVQVTLPLGVSLVQAPPTASIETSTRRRASIDFIDAATRTDPRIQGVSFFYSADAEGGALPGMNVLAFLPVGQPTPGIAVPASAVVWLQGRAWVYVQTSANTFTRREIPTTLPQSGGYVVPALAGGSAAPGIPQSLVPNDPLVVNGAQVLLSQEFSAQIRVGGD